MSARLPAALQDWRGSWLLFALGGAAGAAAAAALGGGAADLRQAGLATAFSLLSVHLALHDARTMLLPNAVTLPGIVIGLLAAPLWPQREIWEAALAGGVVGALLIAPVQIWGVLPMGWGDIKMAIMAATAVGWDQLFLFLVLASLAGGLWAFALLPSRGLRSPFPYAPCLAFGAVVALWF